MTYPLFPLTIDEEDLTPHGCVSVGGGVGFKGGEYNDCGALGEGETKGGSEGLSLSLGHPCVSDAKDGDIGPVHEMRDGGGSETFGAVLSAIDIDRTESKATHGGKKW